MWSKHKFLIIGVVLVGGVLVAVYFYRKNKKKNEPGSGTGGDGTVEDTAKRATDSTADAIAKAYAYNKK